jgi:signal transduction histidine kinase
MVSISTENSTGKLMSSIRHVPLSARLTGGRLFVLMGSALFYALAPFDRGAAVTAPFIVLTLLTFFTAWPRHPLSGVERIGPLPEASLAALAIGLTLPTSGPLLAYLLIPCISAGVDFGRKTAWVVSGASAALILFATTVLSSQISLQLIVESPRDSGFRWMALPVSLGLIALLIRALAKARTVQHSYDDARLLLLKLVDLVRNLPSGLNESNASTDLVTGLREVTDSHRVVLLAGTSVDALKPLASTGEFDLVLDPSLLARVLASDEASTIRSEDDDIAVVPAMDSEHLKMVAVLERKTGYWSRGELRDAKEMARRGAAQIDAARLFAQVRSLAIAEERRRLSREIHDGIAQDLAAIGYSIDELLRGTPEPETAQDLIQIRTAITRLVGELRLSIFELRKDGPERRRFSSLLSDFVRGVAAEAGLTTNIVVDEALEPATSVHRTQLLSIAQEAVTNVRKHAGATSLWVTFAASGEGAVLRVADDGIGMARARAGSFGLDIMRERAVSIGAEFRICDRPEGGTVVEVVTPTVRALRTERSPSALS